MFGLFLGVGDARADARKECSDAYEATQQLRLIHGQLLNARKQAVACSAPICHANVTTQCAKWLREIDDLIPTVTFTAEDGAGRNVKAVRVMLDGEMVIDQLDGKPMSVEPGEHAVRFEMADAAPVEQSVTIEKGEKMRKISASFKQAVAALPIEIRLPEPVRIEPNPGAVDGPNPDNGGVPAWAWVSGGVGATASVVSVVIGVSAANFNSEVTTKCGGDAAKCPDTAVTQKVTAPLAAKRDLYRTVGITFGAVGVVGLGAAIIGIAMVPSKPSVARADFPFAPYISPLGAGVTWQGQF